MSHPVMWFEVLGKDTERLRGFYGSLFGWAFDANRQYAIADTKAGRGIPGGVGEIYPGTRSWVTFYVETPDIAESLAQAQKLGGKVVVPRTVMPDVTLGIFEDPEGHAIGLIEPRAVAQ